MTKPTSSISSRRDLLTALTGAAAFAFPRPAGAAPRRRVGIVGGGMAGVALAWLLDGDHDVVLFESQRSLGGNVQSVPIEAGGKVFAVDVGAQYFHPKLYTSYVRLLKRLGLFPPELGQSHAFPASISLFSASEPTPRFISPVLPERWWPIFAPWNWVGLDAFAQAFGAAKIREDQNADWNLTLEAWLQTLGRTREQWEGMLLPWAASLFTGRTDQARALSARAAMIFAATAVPDSLTDPVVSYVLNRGMAEPLTRMVSQMRTVQIVTGVEVQQFARQNAGGFLLATAGGGRTRVDDVVLAASGPSSLRLLEAVGGTGPQQSALRSIEFDATRIAIHSDPAYAPRDPNFWSFLNCEIHGRFCESSMWLAKVLPAAPGSPSAPQLWKSWVTHRDRQPANVLRESSFRHMVPTVGTLAAQNRLADLQGRDAIWIAGGYTYPFDSQETAVRSAMKIAGAIGVESTSTLARIRALSAD